MKAILTVVGVDRVGIIAEVSTLISKHQINVLDISQTVLSGYFNMVMLVDLSRMDVEFPDVLRELSQLGEELGVQIRMQKSEIFDAMHRI